MNTASSDTIITAQATPLDVDNTSIPIPPHTLSKGNVRKVGQLSQPSLLFAFDEDPLFQSTLDESGGGGAPEGDACARGQAGARVYSVVEEVLSQRRWKQGVPEVSIEGFLRICREGEFLGLEGGGEVEGRSVGDMVKEIDKLVGWVG